MLKEEKDVPGKNTELGEKVAYLENGKFVSVAQSKGAGADIVGSELKILTANYMD